jgi:hypothetical protein
MSIVLASPVLNLKRLTENSMKAPVVEDILYRRGKPDTTCTLVLTGRVSVLAGRDEFLSDAGPWTLLAANALTSPEGEYKPDFTAHIGSDTVRHHCSVSTLCRCCRTLSWCTMLCCCAHFVQ